MNRPTEPNEILAMPDTERDAYAAEVMEWFVVTRKCTDVRWYARGELGEYIMKESDWQPSQPTEKGKAQCWDLIFKFNLTVDVESESVRRPGAAGDCASIHGKVTQAAVVTASILCALAEKE